MRTRLLAPLVLALAAGSSISARSEGVRPSGDRVSLWEVGQVDGKGDEFALAPADYAKFERDATLVIGRDGPKRDWPYVQPGPVDTWAGSRSHTFTIAFGVKGQVSTGDCRLVIDLADSHSGNPPRLQVALNGQAQTRDVPAGGGDRSIQGEPTLGRRHRLAFDFPASTLRAGANVVTITTLSGSWALYDHLAFEAPVEVAIAPAAGTLVLGVETVPALKRRGEALVQPGRLTICHLDGPVAAAVKVGDRPPVSVSLERGRQEVEVELPDGPEAISAPVTVEAGGVVLASTSIRTKPVRRLTVFLLPHSHTDIGYTEVQPRIEQKQVDNLLQGIAHAKRTAGYPEGARFVWNVEVLWAADLYLNRLDEARRAAFIEAVKAGHVALNGMYLNELTGLCRPEELLRLFRQATLISERTGVPIDSAMISDVPGYTWGTVTAMAQAGIRYFSTAPNFGDRIGDILVKWENRPFYWTSPSGKERVLVWIPLKGYALSHILGSLKPGWVADYVAELERANYPYDIAYLRWSGHGDNAVPDPAICDFVKEWNSAHEWPRFQIASTSEAFRAFEARYAKDLPQVRGDWSPYWEDGAGSSALETGLNRANSDRLSQAEALFSMRCPEAYPVDAFERAWKDVLLYSEHTWGAHCSVTAPSDPQTREQWEVKQSYAARADDASRQLVVRALAPLGDGVSPPAGDERAVDVFNPSSWRRREVVLVPPGTSEGGDAVVDAATGRPVPSQRLASRELAILVDLGPYTGGRFRIVPGPASAPETPVAVSATALDNGLVHVGLDPRSGGVAELRARGSEENLVDGSAGHVLNDYLYFNGDDVSAAKTSDPASIAVRDRGPLVASLQVRSAAPGCFTLVREVRLTAGSPVVELLNLVDKKRLEAASYTAKEGKESVNFAFPFRVPGGHLLVDLPIGAIRPEADLMPSACKNWLTVGRWADVSNDASGITWATLDAPLVQVGGLTANLLNSQKDPNTWRKSIEPSQRVYSWAMNNHWHTNYRAYQEGPVPFRYALRPHGRPNPAEASRFAIGLSQPLVPTPARGPAPSGEPLLRLSTDDVTVAALKPSDDRKAWIVRLYGASGEDREVGLTWSRPAPPRTWTSDTSEKPLKPVGTTVNVPAWGIVTLRVDRE